MSLAHDRYLDLLADAEAAERQAEVGPFFPSRPCGPIWAPQMSAPITRESLLAYAAEVRAEMGKQFPDGPPAE